MLKVATVFSGIGAFEQALKRLDIEHEILFACDNGNIEIEYDKEKEFDKVRKLKTDIEKKKYVDELYCRSTRKTNYVKNSYLANYNISEDRFYQDINLLDARNFKNQIDIFVGGSPCQSFSSVGFQKGLEDARGTLFYEYARIIKETQPKFFIYENVRGLFNHDKGKTWRIIKSIFESLGYKIDFQILNSKDFGIPQNRRRLFVIGSKDQEISIPEVGEKNKFKLVDFLEENCSKGSFKSKNGKIKIRKKPGSVDSKYFLSEKLIKYVMSSGTKTFYQNPKIDLEIARPLLATMGNRHRAGIDNYVTVDGKIRMLTEREAHRFMGFDDDYKIVVSRAQAYKQAGNSIVVDVLMEIIRNIPF
ncbi:MAG: DNA cytosine methyltransferase [Metamycoplasmataceae bacterium]